MESNPINLLFSSAETAELASMSRYDASFDPFAVLADARRRASARGIALVEIALEGAFVVKRVRTIDEQGPHLAAGRLVRFQPGLFFFEADPVARVAGLPLSRFTALVEPCRVNLLNFLGMRETIDGAMTPLVGQVRGRDSHSPAAHLDGCDGCLCLSWGRLAANEIHIGLAPPLWERLVAIVRPSVSSPQVR